MALLQAGNPFPLLPLQDSQGRPAAVPPGQTLYAFFKTTCPTCELAWPYLERLRRLAEGGQLSLVAVSQDEPQPTEEFNARLATRIPTLYDPPPWHASDAVGLTSVPTLFLVADGRIRQTLVGFEKQKLEELAGGAAVPGRAGNGTRTLFRPDEPVPALRPG